MATAWLPVQPGGYSGDPIGVGYSHFWSDHSGLTAFATVDAASIMYSIADAPLPAESGKFYWEITVIGLNSAGEAVLFGVIGQAGRTGPFNRPGNNDSNGVMYHSGGLIYANSSLAAYENPAPPDAIVGDVFGVAVDTFTGQVDIYRNGVFALGAATSLDYYTPYVGPLNIADRYLANFGATPFAHTPPTGYAGIDGGTPNAYTLSASAGTVASGGQPATARAARRTVAAVGTIATAGIATALRRGRKLLAAVSAIAIAGQPAVARKGYKVVCTASARAVAGQAAALRSARRAPIAAGAITAAGQASGLRSGRKIAGAVAGIASVGQPAALRYGRALGAAPGAYIVNGLAVTLTKASAGTLLASPGTIATTGSATRLAVTRRMIASPAAATVQGYVAAIRANRGLVASGAAVAALPAATLLRTARSLRCTSSTVALGGRSSRMAAARRIPVTAGGVTIVGVPASLLQSSGAPLPDVEPFIVPLLARAFAVQGVDRAMTVTVRRIVQ